MSRDRASHSLRLAQTLLRSDGGAHDRRVAGAAAEMAGQHDSGFLPRWRRAGAQEGIERHQDPRGAEAALQAMKFTKGSCRTKPTGRRREGLDGADIGAPTCTASVRQARAARRRSARCRRRRRRARSPHVCRSRRARGAGNRSAACAVRLHRDGTAVQGEGDAVTAFGGQPRHLCASSMTERPMRRTSSRR